MKTIDDLYAIKLKVLLKILFALTFATSNFCIAQSDPNKLDIVFVVDYTMSMKPYIKALKENLASVVKEIGVRGYDHRIAVLSFADQEPYAAKLDFTADTSKVLLWINKQGVLDGRDVPENSLAALDHAFSMRYRDGAHVAILLVTDALPHYAGDGSSIGQAYTIDNTAAMLSDMDADRFSIYYSSPKSIYSNFAVSLGWPFSKDTLLHNWVLGIQGITLPLDGTIEQFNSWSELRNGDNPELLIEDWMLLTTISNSGLFEGDFLDFDFLENADDRIPNVWTDFIQRYGVEGRKLLQRALQLGYTFKQEDYYWWNNSWGGADKGRRLIRFENAKGLHRALTHALELEDLSALEWAAFNDEFSDRFSVIRRVNPKRQLSQLLSLRDQYPSMSTELLVENAKKNVTEYKVNSALREDGVWKDLSKLMDSGWQLKSREQWNDWSIDEEDKTIYIGSHEYHPGKVAGEVRQALDYMGPQPSQSDIISAYIKKYKGDPEAKRFLELLTYSDYKMQVHKISWNWDGYEVDKEAKVLELESNATVEEAAEALHNALSDTFGQHASRFIDGAGSGISLLGQYAKLPNKELKELGVYEVVSQYRKSLANGVADAGGAQDVFEENLAWEAAGIAGGWALARTPRLYQTVKNFVSAKKSKRLKPWNVTHYHHDSLTTPSRVMRRVTNGQKHWVRAAVSKSKQTEIDDLTILIRESSERALEDVYRGKAGNLRNYLSTELGTGPKPKFKKVLDDFRLRGKGINRSQQKVGSAYHARLEIELRERLRSDPRFKKYRDRLHLETSMGEYGKPDIRLEFPDGTSSIWDLTSSSDIGHIKKYGYDSKVVNLTEVLYFPLRGGNKTYAKKLFR